MSAPYNPYEPGEQQPGTPLSGSSPGQYPPGQQGSGGSGYGQDPGYAPTQNIGQSPDGYGAQTPGYGAQTPGYGAPTPGYGAQTPGYGQNPGYGGQAAPDYGQASGYGQAPGYAPGPGFGQAQYAQYPQGAYGQPGYPAYAGQRGYLQGGPVGFQDAVRQAIGNVFTYEGRASRSAYWWVVLASTIVMLGAAIIALIFSALHVAALGILVYIVAGLAAFLVGLSLLVRRLHDTDKSGWWALISLIPFGSLVLLVFSLLEGTPGPNRFG